MENPTEDYKSDFYEAEVIESTTIEDSILRKILIKAGRSIALPALEAIEMIMSPFTPPQVRVSLLAALAYLIMPLDVVPDFLPAIGFSDDFVALTAVISLWS